jgi:hypothetical protein
MMVKFEAGEEFYFITADGEWPIYVAASPEQALLDAGVRKKKSRGRSIRVTRVVLGEVQEMEIQEEVITRKLIPKLEAR